jgi:hypothetical protein
MIPLPPSSQVNVTVISIIPYGVGKWEYTFQNERGVLSAFFDEDLNLVGQVVSLSHNGETYEIHY